MLRSADKLILFSFYDFVGKFSWNEVLCKILMDFFNRAYLNVDRVGVLHKNAFPWQWEVWNF